MAMAALLTSLSHALGNRYDIGKYEPVSFDDFTDRYGNSVMESRACPCKEREMMPARERVALDQARAKLSVHGPSLPYPHQSAVRGVGAAGLRELRPRAGRSAWRALYRRLGDVFVIAAVGPEAESDRRGFERMTRLAVVRLEEITP